MAGEHFLGEIGNVLSRGPSCSTASTLASPSCSVGTASRRWSTRRCSSTRSTRHAAMGYTPMPCASPGCGSPSSSSPSRSHRSHTVSLPAPVRRRTYTRGGASSALSSGVAACCGVDGAPLPPTIGPISTRGGTSTTGASCRNSATRSSIPHGRSEGAEPPRGRHIDAARASASERAWARGENPSCVARLVRIELALHASSSTPTWARRLAGPGSLGDRSGGGTSPSTWRTAVEAASDPRCALERSGCRSEDARHDDAGIGLSSEIDDAPMDAVPRPTRAVGREPPADRPSPRRPSRERCASALVGTSCPRRAAHGHDPRARHSATSHSPSFDAETIARIGTSSLSRMKLSCCAWRMA